MEFEYYKYTFPFVNSDGNIEYKSIYEAYNLSNDSRHFYDENGRLITLSGSEDYLRTLVSIITTDKLMCVKTKVITEDEFDIIVNT